MRKWIKKGLISTGLLYASCAAPSVSDVSPASDDSATTSLEQLQLPSEATVTSPPTAPAASVPEFPLPQYGVNTLWLWEVSSDNQPTSYLVGTIHGNFGRDYQEPEALEPALDSVDLLLLEYDKNVTPETAEALVRRLGDEEAFLGDNLTAEEIDRIAERASNEVLRPDTIPLVQPWYVNASLSTPRERIVVNPLATVESTLEQRALRKRKAVGYFETPFSLIDRLAGAPDEEHLRLIREHLNRSLADITDETERLFTVYNALDVPGIRTEIQQNRAESELLFDISQVQRNARWIQLLLPVMRERPVMVAVSVTQLLGESGLISQLESSGFAVKFLSGEAQ